MLLWQRVHCMASPSASRSAVTFTSIATRLRAISEFVSRISRVQSSNCTSTTLVDSAALSKSPYVAAAAGFNPRNYSGLEGIFSPRNVTSFGGLGSLKAEFGTVPCCNVDFSSRLHGWGAPPTVPRFMDGRLVAGGRQQVRKIFVEVKGNDLERAIRKWRRKCKEENLKALKDREYFKKPSEKRVLAVKERDRRIARRSFKMKLNWILSRRQRGF